MSAYPDLIYRRSASAELMAALSGRLHPLVAWSAAEPGTRDLQLRQSPKGPETWASCYVGLTSVLDVYERRGEFELRAHETHRRAGGFDPAWSVWGSLDDLDVDAVLSYVADAAAAVEARWVTEEGAVQATISNAVGEWSVLNRESSLSFSDDPLKRDTLALWRAELLSALHGVVDAPAWLVRLANKQRGLSPDFLAVDDAGRLLVVEAKPAGATAGITGGPAQVALYARMIRAWLDQAPAAAEEELRRQLSQRVALGVSAQRELVSPVEVVPVLALGWGLTSPEAWGRLRTVATTVGAVAPPGVAPLEVYRVAQSGALTRWDLAASSRPDVTPDDWVSSSYADRARAHAVEWKLSQPDLQEDGPYGGDYYPFCLEAAKVARNLLPASQGALDLFAEQRIRWHRGVGSGPTTHLVSSQVQCVNALFSLDEAQIKHVFSDLGIESVVPMDGRLITFEYGGLEDYLGESKGARRQRGAHSTSADAALTFLNPAGEREMVLIEWKYTEQYRGHKLSSKNEGVRESRYIDLWSSGALFTDVLRYEDMFFEPFYQLMRQQMLAWHMQQAREATRVRVVHISPAGNVEFEESLTAKHREVGASVKEVWGKLLKDSSSFLSLDSRVFWDVVPGFRDRYGHE